MAGRAGEARLDAHTPLRIGLVQASTDDRKRKQHEIGMSKDNSNLRARLGSSSRISGHLLGCERLAPDG
jgi:hypothetical protein